MSTLDLKKVDVGLYQGTLSCLYYISRLKIKFDLLVVCDKDVNITDWLINDEKFDACDASDVNHEEIITRQLNRHMVRIMKTIHLPLLDNDTQLLNKETLASIYESVKYTIFTQKNVLIVSQAGQNCSSLMSVYCICKMGKLSSVLAIEDTIKRLKKIRPQAFIRQSFIEQLKEILR